MQSGGLNFEDERKVDWLQSTIPPGPVCLQDPQVSRKDCGRPLLPIEGKLLIRENLLGDKPDSEISQDILGQCVT